MNATRIRNLPDDYRAHLRERIFQKSRSNDESGCLEWTGPRNRHGYGSVRLRVEGRVRYTGAHRAAWLAFQGAIVGDLVIDHLCRNRACVNVAHMELVTNATNALRGDHSRKKGRSGRRPGRELHSCGKHGRGDGYEKTMKNGYTRWVCRTCHRGYMAAWKARNAQTG